jgi:predicted benzoate:H+ symporter BenE
MPRIPLHEVFGAVGNFGTILPLLLAAALAADLQAGTLLLFIGIWFIVYGLYYGLPVPLEPMKAIGVVVIAGGVSAGEIAGSGILLGMIFLLLGVTRSMHRIEQWIPSSVVRGLQAALALVLLGTSARYILADTTVGLLAIAIILGCFLASRRWGFADPSAFVVLGGALFIGIMHTGLPPLSILPLPHLVVPQAGEWVSAAWHLALPQFPLTIGNAILATVLLSGDLFGKKLDPDRLSITTGIMNLVSVPFGAFPMCHGAGGLAAQYRFGARTGLANVIGGVFLVVIALFFAGPAFLALISPGVFGALLIFIAIELGRHSLSTDSIAITGIMAVTGFFLGIAIAFPVGLLLAYAVRIAGKRAG